jgi:hypothetical protein
MGARIHKPARWLEGLCVLVKRNKEKKMSFFDIAVSAVSIGVILFDIAFILLSKY